ncbi:MAG: DUF1616 domain-containing protein [Methanomassiliicoccales archaeon]
MKLLERKDWDVWVIVLGSLLLIGAVYILPDTILRTILGLPFLLFFPGYAALLVLFPAGKDLDIIERVALSFGLSIAITPLVGFGLNYTPFGIRLTPILLSVSAINIALALGGLYRREKADKAYLPFDPLQTWKGLTSSYRKEGKTDKVLSIILVISILASVIALVYVVAFPRQGESFSEFYILGPGGNATGYPHNLTTFQSASVFLGIVNHEHRQVNYTVEVWLSNVTFVDNQTQVNKMYFFDRINVSLPSVPVNLEGNWTKQWEVNYTFQVDVEGQYKLFFLLYLDQEPTLPEWPMMPYHDYAATQSFRIVDAVQNKVQSLNLNLNVTMLSP